MALRLPLPIKLLLSYLCIVAIGAGPTFVYVQAKLEADLMADSAALLVARSQRMAQVLGRPQTGPERLAQLHLLGDASVDRISFFAPSGEVLFDSEIADSSRLENHLSRPEVRFALGDSSAARAPFSRQVAGSADVGIARRISTSSGLDTIYVARRIVGPQQPPLGVLRLATAVDRIHSMTTGTMLFARNAQALAVSLAIGFSLLAAVVFVRPLQRVSRMVQALAAGDIGARVGPLGNDEVGDVGRALEHMAMELRRKLLAAGLGEALLGQLVEALPTACVVFEEDGTVVALNGIARRTLQIEGKVAGQRMKQFAEQPPVIGAVQTAEFEGEPEPLRLELPWGIEAFGQMHVLKRPGRPPLRVFIGSEPITEERHRLPAPAEVQARPLAAVIEEATQLAAGALLLAGVTLHETHLPRQIQVAEASGRLAAAVAAALIGCAPAFSGRQTVLELHLLVEPLRLRLVIDAALPQPAIEPIGKLLEPLGGAIEVLSTETRLWLPRA